MIRAALLAMLAAGACFGQFGNAKKIWNIPICASAGNPDGDDGLWYNATLRCWAPGPGSGGASGVTLQNNGTPVGTRATWNMLPGTVNATLADTGSLLTLQLDVDTTVVPTIAALQSWSTMYVSASGATTVTGCPATPVSAYTTGMLIPIRLGSNLSGTPTFNLCSLGAKNLTESDGSAAATGSSGELLLTWYDGTAIRKIGGSSAAPAPLQGLFFPGYHQNGGNLAATADNVTVQAIYTPNAWTIQQMVHSITTIDAGNNSSICLFSWGGPSVTTATLVASTSPTNIASGVTSSAITQTSVDIAAGWYLIGFTSHGSTMAITRGTSALLYTPVAAQSIATGLTTGGCPASLTGVTTSWTTANQFRLGWRY